MEKTLFITLVGIVFCLPVISIFSGSESSVEIDRKIQISNEVKPFENGLLPLPNEEQILIEPMPLPNGEDLNIILL